MRNEQDDEDEEDEDEKDGDDDVKMVDQSESTIVGTRSPVSTAEVSYEDVLALGLQSDSDSDLISDDDGDDDSAPPPVHARPFFGLLSSRCNIEGCQVTPIAGGRFYHRCTAKSMSEVASERPRKKRRIANDQRTSIPMPPPPPPPAVDDVDRRQSSLSCNGIVVWSLTDSLTLHIGGACYGPSPFEDAGIWRPRPVCRCAERNHETSTATRTGEDEEHQLETRIKIMKEINQRNRREQQEKRELLSFYD